MFRINNFNNKAIFFQGFKEDLNLAQFVVKDLQALNTVSDTKIDFQIRQQKANLNSNDQKGLEKLKRLERLKESITKQVDKLREDLNKSFKTYFKYVDALKKAVIKHKVANCGELSALAQAILTRAGKTANLIVLNVDDKLTGEEIPFKDHQFAVLNIGDLSNAKDPESWDKDAIIVDPWSGIAKRAKQGLADIIKILQIDLEKENISFEDGDLVDMDDDEQLGD